MAQFEDDSVVITIFYKAMIISYFWQKVEIGQEKMAKKISFEMTQSFSAYQHVSVLITWGWLVFSLCYEEAISILWLQFSEF